MGTLTSGDYKSACMAKLIDFGHASCTIAPLKCLEIIRSEKYIHIVIFSNRSADEYHYLG